MFRKIEITIFIFLLMFLTLAHFSNAQANDLSALISTSISPQNPSPGDNVKISLQSFSTDLNGAKITWYVNGVEKTTAVGGKEYYVLAGEAGKEMVIKSLISTVEGKSLQKEVSFIPAGVDLLFEAITYTPPFYKGKAVNVNEATIIFTAIPEIFDQNRNKLKNSSLIYSWKKDGVVLANASGLGKNYLSVTGQAPIRDQNIEVTVTTVDKKITASKSLAIGHDKPKIIFYEDNPLYGIMFNRGIKNNVRLTEDELKIVAFPFFFSSLVTNSPDLKYNWNFDGTRVANQEPINTFTVRQEKSGSGNVSIGLKIESIARIFQFTDNSFQLDFQKQ